MIQLNISQHIPFVSIVAGKPAFFGIFWKIIKKLSEDLECLILEYDIRSFLYRNNKVFFTLVDLFI